MSRRKPWQRTLITTDWGAWSWARQETRYTTRRARKAARARKLAARTYQEARFQLRLAREIQGLSPKQRAEFLSEQPIQF